MRRFSDIRSGKALGSLPIPHGQGMLLKENIYLFSEPFRTLDHRRMAAIFDCDKFRIRNQTVKCFRHAHCGNLIILTPEEERRNTDVFQHFLQVVLLGASCGMNKIKVPSAPAQNLQDLVNRLIGNKAVIEEHPRHMFAQKFIVRTHRKSID